MPAASEFMIISSTGKRHLINAKLDADANVHITSAGV
jgi:hypothetical protein